MIITQTLSGRIKTLEASWVLVETNDGTYGADEAYRCVGSGDPRYADYRIYVQVGSGTRRREGCDPKVAPGRPRKFATALTTAYELLAELRRELKIAQQVESQPQYLPLPSTLLRAWQELQAKYTAA